MIHCPNPSCQALNPDGQLICKTCHSAIPHRYLWVAKAGSQPLQPGTQLAERYLVQSAQIVLDTKPGEPAALPELSPTADSEGLPEFVRPYLYLSSHPVAVPRPYALLSEALLLEEGAIAPAKVAEPPQVLPPLTDCWPQAAPLRQLGWLVQVAQLWQPFSSEQVAGTLLQPDLLRVDGGLVKLLEVRLDSPAQPATLSQLGSLWQTLAATAHPTVQDFLAALSKALQSGEMATGEQLVSCLDGAIAAAEPGQQGSCELALLSDQGPTRQRNEDACYPASGTAQTVPFGAGSAPLLLMVCDGIGGHQGGDVASKLAIAAIEQRLAPLLAQTGPPPPDAVTSALEAAVCAANDEISQQNDQEARQARDRMGTTLVMGLVIGAQLYIAHVGDSRAYRVNLRRCQQVTLDDDIAAREVRLGYGFYRDIAQQAGTGALVQALGMTSSASLYPTVQRFVLDEDCVFLFCSDGLSDNDRVEQFWTSALLPVLSQQQPPKSCAQTLVQLANTHNGHDNVTVAVLHVKAAAPQPQPVPAALIEKLPAPVSPRRATRPTELVSRPRPQPASDPTSGTSPKPVWPLLLGIVVLVSLVGGLVAVLFSGPELRSASTEPLPVADDAPSETAPPPPLTPGTYATLTAPVALQADPSGSGAIAQLPSNTLIQILSKQEAADQSRWVQLVVCGQAKTPATTDLPNAAASTARSDSPAGGLARLQGWILESQLAAAVQATPLTACDPGAS